jgi:hypothetical protein
MSGFPSEKGTTPAESRDWFKHEIMRGSGKRPVGNFGFLPRKNQKKARASSLAGIGKDKADAFVQQKTLLVQEESRRKPLSADLTVDRDTGRNPGVKYLARRNSDDSSETSL